MKEQWEIHWVDYYDLLQVQPTAEIEVVEGAYKQLMLKYHPDKNTSAEATARVKLLNEAKEVLRDPARRARYDAAYAERAALPPRTRYVSKRIREARRRMREEPEVSPRLAQLRRPHLLVHPRELDFGLVPEGQVRSFDVTVRVSGERVAIGDIASDKPWIRVHPTDLFSKSEVIQILVDTSALAPGRRYTGAVKIQTILYGTREIPVAVRVTSDRDGSAG